MTQASARLRFVLMLGVLACAAGAWPVAQVVQQPPGAQAPAVGTGFISGQVIELPSGRPVPEVTVAMLGRGVVPAAQPGGRASVQQLSVITDAQGRFYFARLPNGIYTPRATKQGYDASRAPISVELSDAERVTDIKIRIAPFAVISGTVRDGVGDPVVGTTMFAFKRSVVNGAPGWQTVSKANTDDRGAYRMTGLPAGDYIVCACTRDPIPIDGQLLKTNASEPISLLTVASRALTVGADVVSLDNTVKTFAPRFHPNSASASKADRITLAPGEEKTGVDVSLDLVRATRVSGRVVGAQGPILASSVRLFPAADAENGIDFTQIQPMVVQADGRFDFAPVPPGQYQVVVAHRDVSGATGGPSGLALGFLGSRGVQPPSVPVRVGGPGPAVVDPLLWADEPITVGENGISGLSVALNPSRSVRGRLMYVGAAPQPPAQQFQRIAVTMSPMNPQRTQGFPNGFISPDGTFEVPNLLPGKYSINVQALPGYPTLKSVAIGGQDITDMAIEIGGKDLAEVVVTFIDTPMASLTVTTQMPPPAQAVDDVVTIVFPADRKFWPEMSSARRRFRAAPMPPRGTVTLADLPAGDYFVAVANATDVLDWQDPARLDVLSRRAQRVTLSDGGRQTIEARR